jgi:hypothetical protein
MHVAVEIPLRWWKDLMLSDLSKKQVYTAIILSLLVFLIYYEFDVISGYFSEDLYGVIALAAQSGAIGFQSIGVWYLVSRLNKVFLVELPSFADCQANGCMYTAVKRVFNNRYYIKFIAIFLSPFILIPVVHALLGNKSGRSQMNILVPANVLYDVFNYGVTFTNYILLGTILWILFSVVSGIGETKDAGGGIYDTIDVYCPDRLGGLSPVKNYLFSVLYIFLISVTLLMIGYIGSLPSFINHALGSGLYRPYFRQIAEFCAFSLFSIFGVALTFIGLNRLSSICLKKLGDRIAYLNAKCDDFLKKFATLSPDELYSSERKVNNLKLAVEAYSTEREKLLRWYSDCSGVGAWTTIRLLLVAYIPPLVTVVFQLSQILHQ